jgi:hypothetical protein
MSPSRLARVLATSIGLAVILGGCEVDWHHQPTPLYGQFKHSR